MRRALSSLLLAALAGCASLSESECRERDWGDLGRDDALHGRPPSRLEDHRQACARHGVKPDAARYRSGHAHGLGLYCTPAGGYVSGRRGDHYEDVCPAAAEKAFRPAFRRAQMRHAAVKLILRITRRIASFRCE